MLRLVPGVLCLLLATVVEAQERAAKAFVTDVIRGEVKLPRKPALSPTGLKALVGVAVLLVAVVLIAWLLRSTALHPR